jgi:hypothetical protein
VRTRLAPSDYRYLEFQLWQEGVARSIEYAAARAAARRIAFYLLGAAIALLLDNTRSGWKRTYTEQPFTLAARLSADP